MWQWERKICSFNTDRYFMNKARYSIAVSGLVVSLAGLFLFMSPDLFNPCAQFIVASIYGAYMQEFFWKYLSLVSQGLTVKELASRREASSTFQIPDRKLTSLTLGQRAKNVLKMITRMKNYESNIPSHY